MGYAKPHLNYEQQLDLLVHRGLQCRDRSAAIATLKRLGYYRLSAYVYPFREPLPPGQEKDSTVQFRSDKIQSGVDFSDIEELALFDRKLRNTILAGIETIEIALRTKIAHIAGKRSVFAHKHAEFLDVTRCEELEKGGDGSTNRHDKWIENYDKRVKSSSSEDFVVHHLQKYGRPFPIWIAVEFMDFGTLSRLFELLNKADRKKVSETLGTNNPKNLESWIRSINYVRNKSAHFDRVWNRRLTIKANRFNRNTVKEDIHHLIDDGVQANRLYYTLALMAYLIRVVEPTNRWPVHMKELVRKSFPKIEGISPEKDMGFPGNWTTLDLWSFR